MSEDLQLFQGEEGGGVHASDILVPRADLVVDSTENLLPKVDFVEAELHLISCLNAVAGANMRGGLNQAGPAVLDPVRYAGRTNEVMAGADRNRRELELAAKRHFAAAYGLNVMSDAYPDVDWRVDARTAYEEFLEEHAASHKLLDTYRTRLRDNVRGLTAARGESEIEFISSFNRRFGLRPHARHETYTEQPTDEPESEDRITTLNHRERMEVVKFDPRAGFTPSTRLELNTITAYLDYLDNPEYPLGISNQLLEVAWHQVAGKSGDSRAEGARAVESITWEIGDYAIDATQALVAIEQLAIDLQDVRPNLELADPDLVEIDIHHPGLPYVFQYFDINDYLKHGRIRGLGNQPLRTAEERFTDADGIDLVGQAVGKHKIIHSPYTRPDRTDAFERHFQRRMGFLRGVKGLQVHQVREAIGQIREDQQQRLTFMLQRLEDIRGGFYYEYTQDNFPGILQAIEQSEDFVAAVYAEGLAEPAAAA